MKGFEKPALGVSVVLLIVGIVGGFWLGGATSVEVDLAPGTAVFAGVSPDKRAASVRRWPDAPSQSAGSDWIFDVFSPPIIFFDPQTRTYTLEPPVEREVEEVVFGLELVEVFRELYRFQYRGHLGSKGNYTVQVSDERSGKWLLLKPGEADFEVGVTVLDFSVEETAIVGEEPGATPYTEEAISLVVFDDELGTPVELGLKPRYNPRIEAVLRETRGFSGQEHRLGLGESVTVDGALYEVVALDADAGTATIRRVVAGSREDMTKQLRVMAGAGDEDFEEAVDEPAEEVSGDRDPFGF